MDHPVSMLSSNAAGVLLWGSPVAGFTPEGEPINALILDAEGYGAFDEDTNPESRFFSLERLITFFRETNGAIVDEDTLQNLSLVINLPKHVHLGLDSQSEEPDTEEPPPNYSLGISHKLMAVIMENANDMQLNKPTPAIEYGKKVCAKVFHRLSCLHLRRANQPWKSAPLPGGPKE